MVVGRQPYAPTAFTLRKYSWYSFLLEAESTPEPYCDRKDFMSMKNPLTPAGIEPATFRFVAQHLSHCATVVPHYINNALYNYYISNKGHLEESDKEENVKKTGVATTSFMKTRF